jgi:hypothetical protein
VAAPLAPQQHVNAPVAVAHAARSKWRSSSESSTSRSSALRVSTRQNRRGRHRRMDAHTRYRARHVRLFIRWTGDAHIRTLISSYRVTCTLRPRVERSGRRRSDPQRRHP